MAGRYKRRIVIQSSTETQSATGMPTPTWATFATRWACIEPLRGAERFTAQQVKAEMDLVIRLRYLPGVTAKMRVLYGTRVLRILEVLDAFEEHRETILYCAEWVD